MLRRPVIAALPLLLLPLLPGGPARAGDTPRPEGPSDQVPEAARPYLGTWRASVQEEPAPGVKSVEVERYLLIRWQDGTLQVKTFDWVPSTSQEGQKSNWKGVVRVDQHNTSRYTFNLREDGVVAVGFGGSNGLGGSTSSYWWASGTMQREGENLRLKTTRGYAPSSKGNAWRPVDWLFTQVSTRVLDPPKRGH